MARPLKEGMEYFPHDTDAANDEKIEALRALHGNDGYAFYFIILERIYRCSDAELDVSKPAVLAALISKVGVSKETFEKILDTAFDIGCLDKAAYESRFILTSSGIKKRAAEVDALREKWRKSKGKKTGKPKENPVENPTENGQETGESKVKESKGKEIINDDDSARAEDVETGEDQQATKAADIYSLIQKEFGPVRNGLEADSINDMIDSYPRDWIIEAIRKAVLNKARNTNYVTKILCGWRSQGLTDQDKPWESEKFGRSTYSRFSKKGHIGSRSSGTTDWDKEPDTLGCG